MSDTIHIPATATVNPFELHKAFKSKDIVLSNEHIHVANQINPEMPTGTPLDVSNWLPAAAKKYNISPDLNDYIMVSIIAIPTEIPNRNGVGFPLKELLDFSPEHGRQRYKTFKGMPTHVEHVNKDYTIAKGVIADTYLRRLDGYSRNQIYKLVELLLFDRTRDPDLCASILKGEYNAYSMGAYVNGYTCSYCGRELGKCDHLNPDKKVDFYRLGNHLVYRRVQSPVGFETSVVKTPAYSVALNDYPISIGDGQDNLVTR